MRVPVHAKVATSNMSTDGNIIDRSLARFGVDGRQFRALTKALLWMDLRSQHYAAATATKPTYAVSPVFWVIGQCLAISAIMSLALWLRVNLYMYVWLAISTSMVVLASAVLVEFNEIVFNPDDLPIIGPRPVTPQTYTAARFFNLMIYIIALSVALHLFPAIVGAGADDAGPWYFPAYITAAITASLTTVCLVVLGLAAAGRSESMEQWKAVFAWTQIVIFGICAYGGQLMFRKDTHAVEVWMAFPPDWVHYLPSAWLAKFVDMSCDQPTFGLIGTGAMMLAMTFAICVATVWRLSVLYKDMQPLPVTVRERPMPDHMVGTLKRPGIGFAAQTREQRIGFWLCSRALWQNASLRMRCLYPLNISLAIVFVGFLSGQFSNPLTETELSNVLLPILSVYLTASAVPVMVLNLTFAEGCEAGWVLKTAPVEDVSGIAVGGARAIQLWVVTPLCVLMGVAMFAHWHDPLSALVHAGLTWCASWAAAMAALWFVVPDLPLSQPASKGSSLGPAVIPLAGFSCAASMLAGLHYLFGRDLPFWFGAFAGFIVLSVICRAGARQRFNRIMAGVAHD